MAKRHPCEACHQPLRLRASGRVAWRRAVGLRLGLPGEWACGLALGEHRPRICGKALEVETVRLIELVDKTICLAIGWPLVRSTNGISIMVVTPIQELWHV